jgi:hypothetical protein
MMGIIGTHAKTQQTGRRKSATLQSAKQLVLAQKIYYLTKQQQH